MSISQKKIVYRVIIIHFVVLGFLYFSTKISVRTPQYKPIAVKEVIIKEEEKKAPVYTRRPQRKVTITKKAPAPRRTNAQAKALVQKMRSTLNNMQTAEKKPQAKPLFVPHKIDNIETKKVEKISAEQKSSYVERLIEELQSHLHLPEYGEVKVGMTITKEGMITQLQIIEAKSEKNAAYLKKTLPNLTFPWFNQYAKQEKVHVLFRNEQ